MRLSNSCHPRSFAIIGALAICSAFLVPTLFGQDDGEPQMPKFTEAQALYNHGDYAQAAEQAKAGREFASWDDAWWTLEAKALLAQGRYIEANVTLELALENRPFSIRLLLLATTAALHVGQEKKAQEHVDNLRRFLSGSMRVRQSADGIVALGEAAILFGSEPRLVLDNFFKRAQRETDPPASAFLAAGQLALDKNDSALAAKHFKTGLEIFPGDPDLWHGLARSFMNSDRTQTASAAQQALELNARHAPTLVLLAEHLIDSEAYDEAEEQIDLALEVNPYAPDALALKAGIAYLRNNDASGDDYRNQALSTWSSNPEVDYRIGKILSRKYRFEEAAAAQRRALLFDPLFSPSRVQLAEDLLRLGRESEGWALITQAHDEDPYNVSAYNLVSLHDKLDEFVTLISPNFRVRMSAEEADIYGPRALELLESGYAQLSERYDIDIQYPVTVEIYPDPADFQVRTFGMPGHGGFLGVCFGPLFTINSPSSKQANWESVLWHEFCHSITLTKTRNRMPRWLSEGISVYEEMIANPSWGQRMTIDYQNRIISGRMKKISEMSSSFLEAQGPEDVQFAYYQSYLAVRYIFEAYGIEKVNLVLDALAEGLSANEAFDQIMAPIGDLDQGFAKFAISEAKKLGGEYETIERKGLLAEGSLLLKPVPHYGDELRDADKLIDDEDWAKARIHLEEMTTKAGYIPGEANAHIRLAKVYRELKEVELERETLIEIAIREGSRLDAVQRLLAISLDTDDQEEVKRWSDAWIAISPMASTPWKSLFSAEKALGNQDSAIFAAKAFVHLEPSQAAQMRYELAQLYKKSNPSEAKRQVLMALEDAPRYRLAYELLREINALSVSSEQESNPLIDTSFDI